LLHAWTAGDTDARDQLMTVLYQELRNRAAARLRRERPGHSLQPTALVHEAYLRLVDQRRGEWRDRGQVFGVASEMMRRILVDRARAQRMAKRPTADHNRGSIKPWNEMLCTRIAVASEAVAANASSVGAENCSSARAHISTRPADFAARMSA